MKHRTLLAIGFLAASTAVAAASGPPPADKVPSLIRDMAGTWQVQQRMWPAPNAEPLNLPAAVARRRLLGGFLQEDMRARSAKPGDAFSRVAYFNYNPVSQQYEYFSIDSRAPQMMNERSQPAAGAAQSPGEDLSLDGGSFLAPHWGELSNTTFHYRLVVGAIENDRQRVRLYLTPQAPGNAAEFLAFEYVYTR